MMKTLLGLSCAVLLPMAACGGSSTSNPDLTTAKVDAGSPTADLSGDLATSSFLVVETCAQADYVDARTNSALRTITPWDTSLGKKCLHISSGQSVTWNNVPNPSHPLEAHDANSTQPNPITNTGTQMFPSAGTFGFDCEIHHTLMHGAIMVD